MSGEHSNCIPNIFVVGLHGTNGVEIIEGIVGIANSVDVLGTAFMYKWSIDNKYYTAEVNLYHVKDIRSLNSPLLDTGEAVLLYIDPNKESVLDELDEFVRSLEQCTFEVQLLIADSFCEHGTDSASGLSKIKAQNWCLHNGWELIELNPDTDSDDDELEDDLEDSYGYKRIRQALHAHTWSNLQLKDDKQMGISQLLHSITSSKEDGVTHEVPYEKLENDAPCTLDSDDTEVDFCTLLSSLNCMKEKVASLPEKERKLCAEKVTIAFWRSIGGDEEEISGLDDDDVEEEGEYKEKLSG